MDVFFLQVTGYRQIFRVKFFDNKCPDFLVCLVVFQIAYPVNYIARRILKLFNTIPYVTI